MDINRYGNMKSETKQGVRDGEKVIDVMRKVEGMSKDANRSIYVLRYSTADIAVW